jgi:addiction module HigA family antidote
MRRPTHPGAVIREDILKASKLSVTEAARRLGIARKTLSLLLNEHAALSPELAVRIARATGTSAESWLSMQGRLDLWKAERLETKVERIGLDRS